MNLSVKYIVVRKQLSREKKRYLVCWVCCVECCDVRTAQPQFFGLCAAGRDGFHTQARARLHGKSPLGASSHIIVRGCEDFAAVRFIYKRAKH